MLGLYQANYAINGERNNPSTLENRQNKINTATMRYYRYHTTSNIEVRRSTRISSPQIDLIKCLYNLPIFKVFFCRKETHLFKDVKIYKVQSRI